MNLALLGFVNHSDGRKFHDVPGSHELEQHLRFDFKMRCSERQTGPMLQFQQPESALRVRQRPSGQFGKATAHPAIHLPPQPRHAARICHAVADDKRGICLRGALQEHGNVVRRMLPVAIKCHRPFKPAIAGTFQSSAESGAFAARRLVAQYLGTRAGCGRAGHVQGAVVHYEDRGQMFAYLTNDRLDSGRFVQARNHDGALSGPVHFDCGGVSDESLRVSRIKCRVLASSAFHANTGFMKTIAILGASADRQKFGNKAVRAFRQQGYMVYPVNPKETEIEGLACYRSISDVPVRPQMVSVYLPPPVLLKVLPDIAAKGCDELWLNPGTESDEVLAAVERLSLNGVQACSIVGVGVSPSSL